MVPVPSSSKSFQLRDIIKKKSPNFILHLKRNPPISFRNSNAIIEAFSYGLSFSSVPTPEGGDREERSASQTFRPSWGLHETCFRHFHKINEKGTYVEKGTGSRAWLPKSNKNYYYMHVAGKMVLFNLWPVAMRVKTCNSIFIKLKRFTLCYSVERRNSNAIIEAFTYGPVPIPEGGDREERSVSQDIPTLRGVHGTCFRHFHEINEKGTHVEKGTGSRAW
ncbi:hypothetical protein CDAR_47951 [Caerostris darwini]|uniref:Uncharacterized protein n=1 Tax=Caerostris darwini TaxID=1538125 RepID=A0AAV4VNL7_9ARAC|nr:hypothetical protein CDAR_47951 [Caerostris darwini]